MSYEILDIATEGDLDVLTNALDDCYEPEFVVAQLKRGLAPRCKRILLERNYSDKDYRSTYYHYYAKKGLRYEVECVRLHFFDARVGLRDGCELFFKDIAPDEQPNDTYLGFMVLRPGGLVPSAGLHVGQVERVFASAGALPVVVPKTQDNARLFFRQLFAYVESGFPVFAEIGRIEHAISVVGHTGFRAASARSAPRHFACDMVNELLVMDDHFMPYRAISQRASSHIDYGFEDISTFVVPLPDKIHFSAKNADRLAVTLATEYRFGFNHAALGQPVLRYFLTTSAQLRSFMHEQRSAFEPEFMAAVMQLVLPKFVWMIEIASLAQWNNGIIATRVVADATASPAEELPIFLMHDAHRVFVWERGGAGGRRYMSPILSGSGPLSRMIGNLSIH